MRFHSQNLNERNGRVVGSIARHGRCWLDFTKFGWHAEWTIMKKSSPGFVIDLADYDDDAIGGHLSLGFIALYWGMKHPTLRRWMEWLTSRESEPNAIDCCTVCRHPKADGRHESLRMLYASDHHDFVPLTYWSTNGRNIGIRWFDGTLWIDLWNDPMEHRSVDPKWWHISINPVDIIFGDTKYTETKLSTTRVVVPMPEGGYAATVDILESVWRRPRWPWAWRTMIRSTITPDIPIPFPGKGENAWDCGEDSTHSMTGPYETPFDAAIALGKSVMQDRVRHGGWDWRPAALEAK